MDRTSTEEPHLDRAPELGGRLRGIQSLPFTTVAGFVAAVVALILIAVLSYRSVQEWNRATERTSHTIAVLDAADGVLAALTDAETSQRGYMLTGEERYLQLYWSTGARLDQSLVSLRQLTLADPERRSQVEAIERAAGEKTAELRQTVELRRAGKINEAMQIVLTDRGKSVMDRLRALIGAVRSDEERILDERGRESQRAATSATTVILSGAVALLFLFWGASFLTARDFRARAREAWIRAGQNALGTALQGDRPPGHARRSLARGARALRRRQRGRDLPRGRGRQRFAASPAMACARCPARRRPSCARATASPDRRRRRTGSSRSRICPTATSAWRRRWARPSRAIS